ncbi:thioredoxin domain-containing protein [Kaarinaea lacus]
MSQALTSNRLIQETSPYLLQHAHNPVDWYPWGDEALQKARQENKPILLSIGYSACHWCHVMAHESFEDPQTAQVMNTLFVNIKVDREERPDLDRIYQFAHQVLTQRGGGWPLTMILMPEDQTPFFAGTYFPKQEKYGMPAFTTILQSVATIYREKTDEVIRQNEALQEILEKTSNIKPATKAALHGQPLEEARQQLQTTYDSENCGFGQAPKFPHPTNIERLLRHWSATKRHGKADAGALQMAVDTLQAMALGGLYDQLGGGFCRYSVDEQWMIPHFEKMLYDNGPLLSLYAQGGLATGEGLFYKIAAETAEWVMREMQSNQGGYFSTLDADSEGEEGKFYVWKAQQVKQYLTASEYQVFSLHFGLDQTPNFEGSWHLHTFVTPEVVAEQTQLPLQEVNELLLSARQKLFREREERVHPGRDEKILVSWNALMIKGMTVAAKACKQPDFLASAEQALGFIRSTLWRDGRLLATYKDGKAHLMAYLDDYAFLMDALLELLQLRWRREDLLFLVELAEALLTHFEDKQNGGFYFTADDHEKLIQRPKVLMDDSIPAGNGVAAGALLRLGHLLGEMRYIDAAEKTLAMAWESIQRTPYAHNALLAALEDYLYPPQVIVLRGGAEDMRSWQKAADNSYAPQRLLLAIPAEEQDLPGLLNERKSEGSVVAYVCDGHSCRQPVTDLAAFEVALT